MWSYLLRGLAVVAIGWALWLLGASPGLDLDVHEEAAGIGTLTIHCDAVLQSGDDVYGIGSDGSLTHRRWQVDDDTERILVEQRLSEAADPVPTASGTGVRQPDVELDEAAIGGACDARRSYRTGWAVLVLAAVPGLLVAGRRMAAGATASAGAPDAVTTRRG